MTDTPRAIEAISDAVVRRRLWIVLVIYETLVIAIVAGAGLNIALMGGGSTADGRAAGPDLVRRGA